MSIDKRISYRYGGDTMGGPNDRSRGPAGRGGGADFSRGPDRSRVSPQQTANTKAAISSAQANKDDVREQYRLDTPVTVGQVLSPDFTKVGIGSTMDDNRILASNLANRPYQPFTVPPYIPFSGFLNSAGNILGEFSYEGNRDFFLDKVAGQYGYGYGLEDYEQYMEDRMSGKVGAYGNENMGQNAINERAALRSDSPLQNLLLAQQPQPGIFPQPQPGIPTPINDEEPQGVVALYEQYLKNLGYAV